MTGGPGSHTGGDEGRPSGPVLADRARDTSLLAATAGPAVTCRQAGVGVTCSLCVLRVLWEDRGCLLRKARSSCPGMTALVLPATPRQDLGLSSERTRWCLAAPRDACLLPEVCTLSPFPSPLGFQELDQGVE